MKTEHHPHYFSHWARERFEEIESTLKAIESHAGALHADRKREAEKAVAEIRAQGEAFQEAMRKQQHLGETAWATAKAELAPAWAAFEATVQHYLAETGHDTRQQGAAFAARAEAQHKAWKEIIDSLHANSAAFAAARKQDFDKALGHLKEDAAAAKSKLEKQQKAGEQSWVALRKALEESRSAFDTASQKAFEAFKKAG